MTTGNINKYAFLKYNAAWMLWAIVILVLLTIPGGSFEGVHFWNCIPYFDKIVHFGLFAGLAALMIYGFGKQSNLAVLKSKKVFYSLVFCTAYAAFTEFLQLTLAPGRTGDFLDLLADIIGVAAGIFFLMLLNKKTAKRKISGN